MKRLTLSVGIENVYGVAQWRKRLFLFLIKMAVNVLGCNLEITAESKGTTGGKK